MRIILVRANRFARIDSQDNPIFINPAVNRANIGEPRHSKFYPQSTGRLLSLGNGPKGGLRGAIRNTWVPKGAQIDSGELAVIRANSANDSRE